MFFVTGTAFALAAGYGLRRFLTRDAPKLTDGDLRKIPGMPRCVRIAHKLTDDERKSVKQAFLSGPDFQWMTVGGKKRLLDLPSDRKYAERHQKITSYMVECALRFGEQYGHIFVCRDKSDGCFLGALALIPPYENARQFQGQFMAAAVSVGIPAPYSVFGDNSRGPSARFDAYCTRIEEVHLKIMKDSNRTYVPHWYIANLGVLQTRQGTEVGSTLIKAAIAFAAASSQPIFLECHDENVSFFTRLGFATARRFEIQAYTEQDDMPLYMNCMIRK